MRQHAHGKMIEAGPPTLPPTIVDQIKLWENERNRFTFSEGVLYSQFLSQTDFETLRDHALSTGVLIWQSDRLFICLQSLLLSSLNPSSHNV